MTRFRRMWWAARWHFVSWALRTSSSTRFEAALLLPIITNVALGSSLTATALTAATAAAAAVGSYLDNTFILPALFPPQDVEGPRLGEFRVQFAEEGAALNLGVGEAIRTNGALVWTSDLTEVVMVQDGGGGKGGFGGGGGGEITTYEYYADFAVVFGFTGGAAISELTEIIANGKPIYRVDPLVSFSASATAQARSLIANLSHWRIDSADLGLGDFVAGGTCTVSGFANGVNNGTFTIIAATSDPAVPSSQITLDNPFGLAEGPVSVTITQDVSDFSEKLVESIEIYAGGTSQTPSPTIESFEGAGTVPGWPGYAYVVVKQLYLGEFGNSIPQLQFIWNPGTTGTAGAMIQSIVARSAAPTAFQNALNISDADVDVRGYTLQGSTELHQAIQPLMVTGDLLAQTSGAGLRFFRRKNATIIDVDPEDLATHSVGTEQMRRPVEVVGGSEVRRPDTAIVRYIDRQARYQNGAQRERANVGGTENAPITVNLAGIVLENAGAEARQIARRILYAGYVNGKRIRLSLPMRYIGVQESDVLRIPVGDSIADGVVYYVLIDRVDRGATFVLEVEGNLEISAVLDQTAVADLPAGTDVDFDPETDPIVPVVVDPVAGVPVPVPGPGTGVPTPSGPGPGSVTGGGFRPAGAGTGSSAEGAAFPGAGVHGKRALEDDDEFRLLGTIESEAYGGYAATALAGGVSPLYRDYTSTVDIQFFHGSVASTDTEGLLRGNNTILVGKEVVSFQTATMVSEGRWRLSDLLRGRLGTEQFIGSHAVNETALVLTGPGVRIFPIPTTWIGETCEFRFVPSGLGVGDVTGIEVDVDYAGLRPLSPSHLVSNRDTSNNVTLSWFRRSRAISRPFGSTGSSPVTEIVEQYEVDIIDDSTGDVLGTYLTGVGETTLDLTSTQMTSLGIASASTAFRVRVYQLNPQLGGSARGDSSDELTVGGK